MKKIIPSCLESSTNIPAQYCSWSVTNVQDSVDIALENVSFQPHDMKL